MFRQLQTAPSTPKTPNASRKALTLACDAAYRESEHETTAQRDYVAFRQSPVCATWQQAWTQNISSQQRWILTEYARLRGWLNGGKR